MTHRTLLAAAVVSALFACGDAQARLFRQTYGATVPAQDGCVWNINQDYFVPRYCDTGQYGLFSACKHAHSLSAACRNLHPLYCGYCSPYGACRYRWRDHVYKVHCGCTPLRCYYGPWRNHKCRKHAGWLAAACCGRYGGCGDCAPADAGWGATPCDCLAGYGGEGSCENCNACDLSHVEPGGGILLGMIPMEDGGALDGVAPGAGVAVPAGVSLPELPPSQPQVLPGGFGL